MIHLKVDDHYLQHFEDYKYLNEMEDEILVKVNSLISKQGLGNKYLGWIDLPDTIDNNLIEDIEKTAKILKEKSEVVVVIGIGGSYLGARAIIEALKPNFSIFNSNTDGPQIIYAGNNMSSAYHNYIIDLLADKEFSVIVISKSGTTTEPAIAFRIFRNILENKYGKEEAYQRIVAITDKEKGALKSFCNKSNIKTFVIPDDVGGRFSVLTPVGLLPIAIAGINIREIIEGARAMKEVCINNLNINENPVLKYVAIRNLSYRLGKQIEILVNYNPQLSYITEWWKQLYGESEGKDGEGLFPVGVNNTTDLHSLGQYIQEGQRIIFETILDIEKFNKPLLIPNDADNYDQMNFLSGKSLDDVNRKAMLGTLYAHIEGNVPNLRIVLTELNETTIGELIYFFEFACGVSGYMIGVNPFDQPGVEAYKNNMYALLNKPGYENAGQKLKDILNI